MNQRYTSNAQLLISKAAIGANINTYRLLLEDTTKLLLMVKANGYGTDLVLISKEVEDMVDYLGVAFSLSAIKLRENGIKIPIIVFSPNFSDLQKLGAYNLEPVLYSLEMVRGAVSLNIPINVHLEIDSGMKRIGLNQNQLEEVIELLINSKLTLKSVFSHLVAPSNPFHDSFSYWQAQYFNRCFDMLSNALGYFPLKHLVSSGGINRFAPYQYDMVRLGIGFYGYDPTHLMAKNIRPVACLQSKIIQIIDVKKGESIGYDRKGRLTYDAKVATISIGYGDGYLRIFGNGNAEVAINNKRAKTIGNICMDLMMVDVTNLNCRAGDFVELFGDSISIVELSKKADTIPYEILTNINSRVERILI